MPLPTYKEMEAAARPHLDAARGELSSFRDELRSDWQPGEGPSDARHAAWAEALRYVSQAKELIDLAKSAMEPRS